LVNKTYLRNLGLYLPKFEFRWTRHIGPLLIIKYKKKRIGIAFCHRQKNRCLTISGHTSFLCARCIGILIGFLLYYISISFFNLSLPLFVAFLLMVPLIVDGASQSFNFRISNNITRLITGMLFTPGLLSLLVVTL